MFGEPLLNIATRMRQKHRPNALHHYTSPARLRLLQFRALMRH